MKMILLYLKYIMAKGKDIVYPSLHLFERFEFILQARSVRGGESKLFRQTDNMSLPSYTNVKNYCLLLL
jgi:hypothetical protein